MKKLTVFAFAILAISALLLTGCKTCDPEKDCDCEDSVILDTSKNDRTCSPTGAGGVPAVISGGAGGVIDGGAGEETPAKAGSSKGGTGGMRDSEACFSWGPLEAATEKDQIASGSSRCYRFQLDEVGTVSFTIDDNPGYLIVSIVQDANKDEIFDNDERVTYREIGAGVGGTLTSPLEKGEYYLRVTDGNTTFSLTASFKQHPVASPETEPGDRPNKTAVDLGTPDGKSLGGYIGTVDSEDYYRFVVDEVGAASFTIDDNLGYLIVSIVQDANENGVFDNGERVTYGEIGAGAGGTLTLPLEKGEYYVRVTDGETTYSLTATFKPHPVASPEMEPGDKPNETAVDLGTPDGKSIGGYIGTVDSEDYYRFVLDEVGTVSFTIEDNPGYLIVSVVQDANENGVFDNGERVTYGEIGAGAGGTLTWLVLEQGTYFVRLSDGNTTYTLVPTWQPQ